MSLVDLYKPFTLAADRQNGLLALVSGLAARRAARAERREACKVILPANMLGDSFFSGTGL